MLRKYRNKNSLSQEHVSNCLNISRQAYQKWENNDVNFNISQLKKIAELYKIPLHMIITESYTYY
ncbi:helix-turn-helix transcriptional regulator [Pedobacter chitinilyticus]